MRFWENKFSCIFNQLMQEQKEEFEVISRIESAIIYISSWGRVWRWRNVFLEWNCCVLRPLNVFKVENGANYFTRKLLFRDKSTSVHFVFFWWFIDFHINGLNELISFNLFLIAFEPFRKFFLLLFFPFFLWFHSFQLSVPNKIDEATLLCNYAFDPIREIDCRLVFVAVHRRQVPDITNDRPRGHHQVQILHHWISRAVPEGITKASVVPKM